MNFKRLNQEKGVLNSADVKKVEYLIYLTNTRLGNDHYVINIILNYNNYSGYVKITETDNILAGSRGLGLRQDFYKRITYQYNKPPLRLRKRYDYAVRGLEVKLVFDNMFYERRGGIGGVRLIFVGFIFISLV